MNTPRQPILENATLQRVAARLRAAASRERKQARDRSGLDRRAIRASESLEGTAASLTDDIDTAADPLAHLDQKTRAAWRTAAIAWRAAPDTPDTENTGD
jgi:hypothetical protein